VAGLRGGAAGGSPCARRTRTMKQCSSDARTVGHPTHSPFEFTATGMEREGKGLVDRARSGPALLLARNNHRPPEKEEERDYRPSQSGRVAGASNQERLDPCTTGRYYPSSLIGKPER